MIEATKTNLNECLERHRRRNGYELNDTFVIVFVAADLDLRPVTALMAKPSPRQRADTNGKPNAWRRVDGKPQAAFVQQQSSVPALQVDGPR